MNPSLIENLRVRVKRVADMGDTRSPLALALNSVQVAIALTQKIEATEQAERGNVMLPVEGRQRRLQDGVEPNLQQIRALEKQIAGHLAGLASERVARERLPAPSADPVAVQLRAEMRAMLRGLDSQSRLAATSVENLDGTMLEAILEAPPALSGLPPQIVHNLRRQLVEAKGVDTKALDHVDSEIRALTDTAIAFAYQAAGAASELDKHVFEGRVAALRSEKEAVDRSQASTSDLLAATITA